MADATVVADKLEKILDKVEAFDNEHDEEEDADGNCAICCYPAMPHDYLLTQLKELVKEARGGD